MPSDDLSSSPATISWYHEKQWLGHCAIHTLNNLFQRNWMTYSKMKTISTELYSNDQNSGILQQCSWNPYSSSIPYLGYFDIGCIVLALKEKDCEIIHHIVLSSDVENLDLSSELIIGLIINEANSSLFGFWNSRHWYAILIVRDHTEASQQYYLNLDSELTSPQILLDENELKLFLQNEITTKQSQIFVVSKVAFTT